MLKRIFIVICVIPFLTACDQATLKQVLDTAAALTDQPLTQQEIGSGLKEALTLGISKGADVLSKEGGYFNSPYKILLPEEARKITKKLQGVPGFKNIEEEVLSRINRGAEDAAKKAKPIFVSAIKQISFKDATQILMGDKNAATSYLQRTTESKLYQEFNPVIIQSLDKFNARKYWKDAVDKYNKIPFIEKLNPSLDDYVTQQALVGLFDMVQKKELDIRENTVARTSDLLKRVFSKQD